MNLKRNDMAATSRKSKPFAKAVEDLAHKDQNGMLRIYEKSGLKGKYLAEIPIADAVELAKSFEESLKAEFGGGEYQVALCNRDTEIKSKYSFDIAGAPKGRKASEDESLKGRRAGNPDRETLNTIMGKLADGVISSKTSAADEWQRTLELAKTLKGDDGLTPKDLIELAQALQGQGGGGGEIVGAFMDGFQLRGEVQPNIEREDSTTAIVQAILPLLASFIGRKQGIAPGAVDPALLQQVEQAVAQQLQGVSSGAPVAGHPPPPGASHIRAADPAHAPGSPAQAPSAVGGSVVTPQEQATEAPPVAGSQEYFMLRFVRPFQKDVAEGQPDDELAYQIVSMIEYARDRMADNPPPIVADFVSATNLVEHDAALKKFFAALPELANLKEKCEGIKNALIRMFAQGPGQDAAAEDIANVQDAGASDDDQPDIAPAEGTAEDQVGLEFETEPDENGEEEK